MKKHQTIKLYDSLTEIDDRFIREAETQLTSSRPLSSSKRIILVAAILAILLLGGIAIAYNSGLFNPWLQRPSLSPVETVRSAIENEIHKEYTFSVRVGELVIDERATQRAIQMYRGSDRAKHEGWSDEYLENHMIVVYASYYVEYDHEKTFLKDGEIDRYFILTRDENTMKWKIWDNTTPGAPFR